LKNGFQAFLAKPIDMLKLDAILKRWVRDKSREDLDSPAPGTVSQLPDDICENVTMIQIPGVDSSKGMALYGDDADLYISVIESYARNTPAVISNLRNVRDENLAEYAITVHGLKGASNNIGAVHIGQGAERMEKAAKAGNLDVVLAENATLLEETEKLVDEIQNWLNARNAEKPKPVRASIDPELLERLRNCCENFDMSGVDETMARLTEFSYENNTDNDLIVWLCEKTATSEFDEIVMRINDRREGSK